MSPPAAITHSNLAVTLTLTPTTYNPNRLSPELHHQPKFGEIPYRGNRTRAPIGGGVGSGGAS